MTLLVMLAGLAVAALGALSRSGGRHLRPRVWARFGLGCTVGAAAYVWAGLALLSAPVVLGALGSSSLVDACRAVLARLEPGGPALSWAATVLLASCVVLVSGHASRSRATRASSRIEPSLGTHERRVGFELVILPTSVPLAYSVGGSRPQVVVSEGLRRRLGQAQLAAVLAHEAAHVRGHHDRWLDLADLSARALWFVPWAARAADTVRVALERWADEEAAREAGREPLRSALLLAADVVSLDAHVAGLTGADALAERVARLETPPVRSRAGLIAAMSSTLVAVGIVGGVAMAAGTLQVMALISRLCPLW